eukprot:244300_1
MRPLFFYNSYTLCSSVHFQHNKIQYQEIRIARQQVSLARWWKEEQITCHIWFQSLLLIVFESCVLCETFDCGGHWWNNCGKHWSCIKVIIMSSHHILIYAVFTLLHLARPYTIQPLSWTQTSSPFSDCCSGEEIAGYYDSSIWFIGNWVVSEYNIVTNISITHDGIVDRLESGTYTQIDHKLYIYPQESAEMDYIVTFDMRSQSYNNEFAFKHDTSLYAPCITNSASDFLFVLGGYHRNTTTWDRVLHDGFHIFDLVKAEWIDDGPSMPKSYYRHSCNAHPDGYLYVIPGLILNAYYDASSNNDKYVTHAWPKLIRVSNMSNINNMEWTGLASGDILDSPRYNHKSVIYGGYIYIIGGHGTYSQTFSVEAIDTYTQTLGYDSSLITSIDHPIAVVAQGKVFVFGIDNMEYAQLPPTAEPTVSPTTNTLAPTASPSSSPTDSPTSSPTRFPTQNVLEIYNASFLVLYSIHNLTLINIQMIEDDSLIVLPNIVEIVERHYVVPYKDFVIRMNDFDVYRTTNRVSIHCTVSSRLEVADTLTFRTNTDEFEQDVTTELMTYFENNSQLLFYAQTVDAKTIQNTSYFMLILSVSILFTGFVFSVLGKMLNGCPNGKVDNAQWLAPILYSLQVYDLVTDINLSRTIWMNPMMYSNGNVWTNPIFWCGIGSVVFLVVPYSLNLLYGIRIKKQTIIKNNEHADTYFVDSALFIGLIVMSGGMYPSLLICSSRLFNLELLDAGLSKHELYQLSKIRMRSTVLWEDFPNLGIQIIYAHFTSVISSDVFMAFIASSLSIILAVSTYFANRFGRKHSVFVNYHLLFRKSTRLTDTEKENISNTKGRKEELAKSMANIFVTSHQNIEIGFVTVMNDGLKMIICHSLSVVTLLRHYATEDIKTLDSIDKRSYIEHVMDCHYNEINVAFRGHFEVSDAFVVEYMDESDTNNLGIANNTYQSVRNEQNVANDDEEDDESQDMIHNHMRGDLYQPVKC